MSTEIKVEMTAEEYAEFQEMKRKRAEDAEKEKALSLRDNYKDMVSSMVNELFPVLENMSNSLAYAKKRVYESFNTAIELKRELYDTKEEQNSHTFTNKEGTKKISVGYNVIDNYDDTVNEGVAKVKEYLASLADTEDTKKLVDVILQLLSKDKKGNIKPSKVVTLSNLADKSDSDLFKDGVRIIMEAYNPQYSKQYVRAEKKDKDGSWVNVPLGMTEAGV
jgi:hypothetical protein